MSTAMTTNNTIPAIPSAAEHPSVFEAGRSPAIPSLHIFDVGVSEGGMHAEETREPNAVSPSRSSAVLLAAAAASIQETESSDSRHQQSLTSHQQQPPTVFRKKAHTLMTRFLSTPRRASTASSNSSTSQMSDSNREESSPIEEQALVTPARTSFLAQAIQKHHSASALWSTPWKRFHRANTHRTSSLSSEEIVLFEEVHSSTNSGLVMDQSKTEGVILAIQKPKNVMQWLNSECPTDVLPHILAFCGPQMTNRLRQVNQFWRRTVQEEGTWKVLCQDMHKVG